MKEILISKSAKKILQTYMDTWHPYSSKIEYNKQNYIYNNKNTLIEVITIYVKSLDLGQLFAFLQFNSYEKVSLIQLSVYPNENFPKNNYLLRKVEIMFDNLFEEVILDKLYKVIPEYDIDTLKVRVPNSSDDKFIEKYHKEICKLFDTKKIPYYYDYTTVQYKNSNEIGNCVTYQVPWFIFSMIRETSSFDMFWARKSNSIIMTSLDPAKFAITFLY